MRRTSSLAAAAACAAGAACLAAGGGGDARFVRAAATSRTSTTAVRAAQTGRTDATVVRAAAAGRTSMTTVRAILTGRPSTTAVRTAPTGRTNATVVSAAAAGRPSTSPARPTPAAQPTATVAALKHPPNPPGRPRLDTNRRFGLSTERRPLLVSAFGTWGTRPKVLVVGCIHGTECAGNAIARRVIYGCPPVDGDVWVIRDLNPDGRRLGTRLNGRGVDLNRNFPTGWRANGTRGDPQYPGPRPLSEPESRAATNLIRWLRPTITIWYHQGEGPYVRAWGGSVAAARRYATAAGLPFREMPWLAGTAPHWQNSRFPGTSSFVVELPAGRTTDAAAMRHAAAVERLAGYRGANRIGMRGSSAAAR
ncbi:MAG TPA: M14 family zinc carboxypeptidase [Thermoleophilaceae bacterium]|jgi:protein MpaA